ncbi:putative outer membrane starch-binding protein [Dysgonomonas alginatilytica]|uniref:Putative outer membrane starch-binding protein n=1 Tax=Dysgonomonas alginatilytica TaxID=1605892 RepID=A0A2V3PPZ6_9BACT|nr:RagB/SusD family nutrient uptake outer membrane protein [Dysgonomonas alginatilytica]PXV63038.1 putative outer membrane starch-binding protein [Dysgonomonas alginatilytica]
MKNIYLFLIVSIICLSGCDLEKLPETSLTDEGFWKTETDVRGACNRMYDELAGFTYMSNPNDRDAGKTYHDSRSDELVQTSANGVSAGNRTVPSTSRNDWTDPYIHIFTANNILQKAPKAALEEAVLNRWLAEAYFFRAYYHFLLVKLYGDIPLILKSFDDPNDPVIYSGRTPREEVIQQCYKDLEFAATWLPTRATLAKNEKDWGRATRSSALGMIVRIGLYEGTFVKYHKLGNGYTAHLKKSIDAAELLMKEGHDLYSDFDKLFKFEGEGSKNLENIFVKVYGPNGAGTAVHGNCRAMENTYSVTRQMIDLFLYKDGLPREKSPLKISPETSFDDALTNRDPRLKMTIYSIRELSYKNSPYIPFINQHGYGYSLKKGYVDSEWNTVGKETIDKAIIRYGEILISYAEALYEHNGSITDDQLNKTVNKLRDRVGFDVKLTNEFATANGLTMIDEIRRERTVELLDEGFRYDDIIRWKIAEKVLPTYIIGAKFVASETNKARADIQDRLTDATGKLKGKQVYSESDMYVIEMAENRRFDPERDYLYPIPLNEVALSKGNITQNPNW